MIIWPGYRLRLSLGPPRAAPVRRRVWLAAAVIGLLAGPAIPAAAATNPAPLSVSVSVVPQAVKSVTLSVSSTTYTNCVYGSSTSTQLGFPNGACQAADNPIKVTNGTAPATILVNGANMVPADNGTNWTLASGGTIGYTSASPPPAPGANQYLETTSSAPGYDLGAQIGSGFFQALSNTATCDLEFPACAGTQTSPPGASENEYLAMSGPSSSTDLSSTFATTVTWTAS